MSSDARAPGIWVGQGVHFLGLGLLLGLLWMAWRALGEPHALPFWCAAALPVMHQIFVWLAWRVELASAGTSRTIGFLWYVVIFFVLFSGRFVSLLALGWVDRGSLGLSAVPRGIAGALLLVPGVYAMYSVGRYFGMSRAAGADHFDPGFRDLPLVRRGIFRFTSNGMYVYAFLLFWAIAILLDSSAALAVAAFSHVYIWVHFFATERPDMRYLYASEDG
ncbi:MAG: methyltransferase [Planctomycetota bacterium]